VKLNGKVSVFYVVYFLLSSSTYITFWGYLDHADYESDIGFSNWPSGGSGWFRVPQCQCISYYWTQGMILVDHDEGYQNITKSSHIATKKVVLLWGQKSYFFSYASKSHLKLKLYNSSRAVRIIFI
jgi:hypothetical protein